MFKIIYTAICAGILVSMGCDPMQNLEETELDTIDRAQPSHIVDEMEAPDISIETEWTDDAFQPVSDHQKVQLPFLDVSAIRSAMNIPVEEKGLSTKAEQDAIKYETEDWAIQICASRGAAWYVNKKVSRETLAEASTEKDTVVEKELSGQSLILLEKLGLVTDETVPTGFARIVDAVTGEKNTQREIAGYVLQYQRKLDGVDVFSSRASIRYNARLEMVTWQINWYGSRATLPLSPMRKPEIQEAISTIIQKDIPYQIDRRWLALPSRDGGTIIVPGYVLLQEHAELAIPAISFDDNAASLFAIPPEEPTNDTHSEKDASAENESEAPLTLSINAETIGKNSPKDIKERRYEQKNIYAEIAFYF